MPEFWQHRQINGTEYSELFYATPEAGTYNHAVMIAYHDNQFLVSWKNSPTVSTT